MTNNEVITQLKSIRNLVDALINQLSPAPNFPDIMKTKPSVSKHVGGIAPIIKLVTAGQLGMFYAIRKKHGITDEAKDALLKETYGVIQECDLPFQQAQAYREDLLNLAIQTNPHFPTEKFLSDGTLNPEWVGMNVVEG